jgi:acylphosphatase
MTEARVTETILFSGRVQGVGFRWTTERLARDLPVTGFVRNLADGRVEVVATGDSAVISRLIKRLKEHFGAGITEVERHNANDPMEFSGFTIRR